MKPFLSVIIPTYNEEKRLPFTLVDVDRQLKAADYSYEIIVVDNGSSDSTPKIMETFAKIIPSVRLIEGVRGKGKGYAVKLGMLSARGNYRLFMDADNATSIDQFGAMIQFFKTGCDAVIGSRYLRGSVIDPPQPLWKRSLGRIGNVIIRIFLLRDVKDTQCGFKCFSEEAAEKIFRLISLEGWGFDFESLVIARGLGLKVKEMPVRWSDIGESKVKLSAYLLTLRDVAAVKLNILLKRYKW